MTQLEQLTKMRWILFWVITSLFVIIVMITLFVLFFGGGSATEEERSVLFYTFIVEIGVAVFALFYSVFGLKKYGKKTNHLDREGFKTLISLHFHSVMSSLMKLFGEVQLHNTDETNSPEYDHLVKKVISVIHESRDKLSIFSVDGIQDINAFLENKMPLEKLESLVLDTVSAALKSGDPEEQRKRAIDHIRLIQVSLLKDINDQIMGLR